MLTHLAITNIALIASLQVEFRAGFTALTGETGAGKSLLMDALGLALGARADAGLIRHGEAQADVTATFTPSVTPALTNLLEEQGLQMDEGQLILRRQLRREGAASKAWVNGTPVPATTLAQLAAMLVDVQAQHGQQALLNPATQRDVLDALAGHQPLLQTVAQTHAAWRQAQGHAQTLAAQLAQAQEESERLTQWRAELEELDYQPGEEETLASQRTRLANLTQLQTSLAGADDALSSPSAALSLLRSAARCLSSAAGFDASLQPLATRLEGQVTELSDAAHDIARALSGLETEGNIEQVDDRLHALRAAARRHQCEVSQLPETLQKLTAQTTGVAQLEAQAQDAETAATNARSRFHQACAALTQARTKTAPTLTSLLEQALRNLMLPHAALTIALTPLPPQQWSSHGAENVELLLAANPGNPAQPITKVASGGELSRLMLALKSVLYQGLPPQTVVFDEIDTGLSGASASAVGRSMAQLGASHQVLAITHHPQVAACATHHFAITKKQAEATTTTHLEELSPIARVEELARLLSGNRVTPQARAAAQALLEEHVTTQKEAA